MYKAIALRFLRVFASGALATLILLPPVTLTGFHDLKGWLVSVLVAIIYGGLTATFAAFEKWIRYKQ